MSGPIYDIAKRAVHAYINTGSVPQYVATQVERDVTIWMDRKLREAKAAAWDEGATAGWKQSGEGWNAEYPDESTGTLSVDLSVNPYKRTGDQ